MNAGPPANGQPICDWSRYVMVVEELKKQMVLLLTDYLQGANGTDRKLLLYVSVQVIKYLEDRLICVSTCRRGTGTEGPSLPSKCKRQFGPDWTTIAG